MPSLFSAIRNAVRSGAADDVFDHVEGEPGAQALNSEQPLIEATTEGGTMSGTQTVAGAASAAAATIAAVAAASGGSDGSDRFKTAMDRMNAILGADGIKGDAKRMSAALDLANASPDMSADAVVAFVTANVAAANVEASERAPAPNAAQPSAAAYEQRRLSAADLAQPGGTDRPAVTGSKINRDAIFAARRNAQKGA